MAITILTNPAANSTAQDDLWHVVSSSASGSTDMKYIFEIFVNGIQKISVRQFPEPSNGKAYFNAGSTVRNSMTFNWFEPFTTAYGMQPNLSGEMALTYNIRFGEEVSGITTLNLASGSPTVLNWNPSLFKRRQFDITKVDNFWTNRPQYNNTINANSALGENLYIGYKTTTTINLECKLYDVGNNLISQATGTTKTIPNGFVQLNLGTAALASELGLTFNDSVSYYYVRFNNANRLRVNLVCNPKYTPVNIHFLNAWSMWDSQRFDLVSKLNMAVDRKMFEQRDYKFNGNAVDYKSSYNRVYDSAINYNNKSTFTYKVTADALTDDEYTWMADLIVSPQILMEIDGYFYPVTLQDSNYEFSKTVFNKLKALELTFNMNQTRYSQLR